MIYKLLGVIFGASVAATFFIWKSQQVDQSLEQDFVELFERCRTSIETGQPFDSTGLEETEVRKNSKQNFGMSSEQVAWALPGSEFQVLLTAWVGRNNVTRHLCDIELQDERRPLSPVEQGLLMRQFAILQGKYVGARTHKLDPHIVVLPPSLFDTFLLAERNPRGCSVLNTISMGPDGYFFSAGSGEQATKECETEKAALH